MAKSTREKWQPMYGLLKEMRSKSIAPVDTIGCASLADRIESPKILVSLLLSSQTKDEVTAAAVERLKKLPGGLKINTIQRAEEGMLADILKPVGFYRRKASSLKQVADILASQYSGDIPPDAEGLMKLPGIGPKMAYLAMQHAWDVNAGIGVDVHVHRIANRLGWLQTKEPEATRRELESFIPPEHWKELNHMLVGFGQTVCKAVAPRCEECLLNQLCPSATFKPTRKGDKPARKRVKTK